MFTLFYPWAIKFLTFCLMSYKFEAERHEAAKEIAGGKKSEQHPYHPHPKPSSVQSAEGGAHQESASLATNEHARIDHQPSQQASSARNELSLTPKCCTLW